MGCTVYVDQVLLGNMVMNYAILWIAAKLCRVNVTAARKAAGAAAGALYSVLVFLPGAGVLMSVYFKILVSVLIALLTCFPQPPRTFFTFLACFYLASFSLGGIVLGSIFFINSQLPAPGAVGTVIERGFWPGVMVGLPVFYMAGRGLSSLCRRKAFDNLFKLPVQITFLGGRVEVNALVDTGNDLFDPLTGRPVIVCEYKAVKPVLPPEIQAAFCERDGPDIWETLGLLGQGRYAGRFVPVSFSSIGLTGGLLVGFKPDGLTLLREGCHGRANRVIVALYHGRLDPEGGYSALLHPSLLEDY